LYTFEKCSDGESRKTLTGTVC